VRFDLRHLIVPDRTLDGATSDVEVTAGVTYRFGGTPARFAMARPRPAPAPAPGDRDGDGVLDNVDRCPTTAEDADSFEDADGCVDPDNDRDGVVDIADSCPLVPRPRTTGRTGCADGSSAS
jgi:hypothetical protein